MHNDTRSEVNDSTDGKLTLRNTEMERQGKDLRRFVAGKLLLLDVVDDSLHVGLNELLYFSVVPCQLDSKLKLFVSPLVACPQPQLFSRLSGEERVRYGEKEFSACASVG